MSLNIGGAGVKLLVIYRGDLFVSLTEPDGAAQRDAYKSRLPEASGAHPIKGARIASFQKRRLIGDAQSSPPRTRYTADGRRVR